MKIIISLFLVGAIFGCAISVSADSQPPEKGKPASASSAPSPGEVGGIPASIKGTVLETMDAAGYTYMRLKTAQGEIWAAVPKTAVKKGSEATIVNAVVMDGFESKTLKRKFDHIVFGSMGGGTGAADSFAPLAPGHGTPKGNQAAVAEPHAGFANAPAETGKINVKKAEGAEGRTIAEIFAGKVSLKDKAVAVRGKVVKYNPGIMGKNWIHLRDGSGSREKKDDDLTVTTLDAAAVGDVVLVKGTVHLDRDFGAGYAYQVIIEDAQVSK
jgi:hypothetical protein